MPTTLHDPTFRGVLDRLRAAAARDADHLPHEDGPPTPLGARERAESFQDCYLPVSEPGGELLYCLARAVRPTTVVEFGTSFAISTLYLAAALTDNDHGRVFGTELSRTKVESARNNLAEAGLDDRVTILPGDARQALAEVPGPVELVLLDGWKDLCLPVLRLLETRLAPGALVVADDIEFPAMAGYLAFVRDPANGYVSVPFPVEDGMEISCWTGPAGTRA